MKKYVACLIFCLTATAEAWNQNLPSIVPHSELSSDNVKPKNNTDAFSSRFVKITLPEGIAEQRSKSYNIPKEYYMGKYAVTNAEWNEFIDETGKKAPKYWKTKKAPKGKETHPVLWISYYDAVEYCNWMNSKYRDYIFRIPTREEWEYAATGENNTAYPWGNDSQIEYVAGKLSSVFNCNSVITSIMLEHPETIATYNNNKSTRYGESNPVGTIMSIDNNGRVKGWVNHKDYTGFIYTDIFSDINENGGYTVSVDSYPEGISPWGCYNMSGNCWEWTSTTDIATNGAEKGKPTKIIKGGSWYATPSSCKVTYQGEGRRPNGAYATVGFRIMAEKRHDK